jgi:hypothetical protein
MGVGAHNLFDGALGRRIQAMLDAMRSFFLLLLAAGACGDPCDDLQEVCDSCPTDTAGGLQAKNSCISAVESGDELGCEDRIDTEIYAEYGCSYD